MYGCKRKRIIKLRFFNPSPTIKTDKKINYLKVTKQYTLTGNQ